MALQLGVSTEKLQETCNKMEQYELEMKTILDRINGEVSSLGNKWQGDAANTLPKIVEKMEKEFTKLEKDLIKLSRALSKIGVNYKQTEADNEILLNNTLGEFD